MRTYALFLCVRLCRTLAVPFLHMRLYTHECFRKRWKSNSFAVIILIDHTCSLLRGQDQFSGPDNIKKLLKMDKMKKTNTSPVSGSFHLKVFIIT